MRLRGLKRRLPCLTQLRPSCPSTRCRAGGAQFRVRATNYGSAVGLLTCCIRALRAELGCRQPMVVFL
jgi:hypothetical protein